jgi:hypothetical protein
MKRPVVLLFALLCSDLRLTGVAFAGTPTPGSSFDTVAQELDKAKAETQRLKDVWDKERLQTTLYEQRMKRAAQKFAKAAKDVKTKTKEQKERAEIEFQLAVEKRKLAYNEWQAAQLRAVAKETQLKALDQEKDNNAIRMRIDKLEVKLKGGASSK